MLFNMIYRIIWMTVLPLDLQALWFLQTFDIRQILRSLTIFVSSLDNPLSNRSDAIIMT